MGRNAVADLARETTLRPAASTYGQDGGGCGPAAFCSSIGCTGTVSAEVCDSGSTSSDISLAHHRDHLLNQTAVLRITGTTDTRTVPAEVCDGDSTSSIRQQCCAPLEPPTPPLTSSSSAKMTAAAATCYRHDHPFEFQMPEEMRRSDREPASRAEVYRTGKSSCSSVAPMLAKSSNSAASTSPHRSAVAPGRSTCLPAAAPPPWASGSLAPSEAGESSRPDMPSPAGLHSRYFPLTVRSLLLASWQCVPVQVDLRHPMITNFSVC